MGSRDIPIDRGWAWFTVLGGFVNQMFVVGGARSFGVIFVHMMEHFDASTTSSTLAMGLMAFGLTLYSPIATLFAKRYSFRLVAMIGAAAQGISFFSAAFAPNIYAASLLIGIIDGVGVGFIFAPSISAVGQYFVKHRSIAIGIASAGTCAGQLTIPLLVRFLLDTYGFRGSMMIYGAVTWHCLAASALLRPQTFYTRRQETTMEEDGGNKEVELREKIANMMSHSQTFNNVTIQQGETENTFSDDTGRNDSIGSETDLNAERREVNGAHMIGRETESNASNAPDPRPISTGSKTRARENQEPDDKKCCDNPVASAFKDMFDPTIIKRPLFIFYTIGVLCANTAAYNTIAFLPAFAKEAGLTKQQASIILATSGFADLPGRVFSAVFNNFQLFSTRHLMSVALVVIITASAVCLQMPSFASLMALGAVLGCFGGIYFALFPVYLLEFMGPQKFPAALALTLTMNGVGNLLVPLIAGAIHDNVGNYTVFTWMLIVMETVAVVMYQLDPLARRVENKKHKKVVRSRHNTENSGNVY